MASLGPPFRCYGQSNFVIITAIQWLIYKSQCIAMWTYIIHWSNGMRHDSQIHISCSKIWCVYWFKMQLGVSVNLLVGADVLLDKDFIGMSLCCIVSALGLNYLIYPYRSPGIFFLVYLLYSTEPLCLFGSRRLYEPCFYWINMVHMMHVSFWSITCCSRFYFMVNSFYFNTRLRQQ